MLKTTIAAAAGIVLGLCTTAQAQDVRPIDFYVGGALDVGKTEATLSGFNTTGLFTHQDTDNDNHLTGSVLGGIKNVLSIGPYIGLRVEGEYRLSDSQNYVLDSFPGVGAVPTFFYATTVKSEGGFANLWVDFDIPDTPITLYAGGGVGAFSHRVSFNDTVVAGSNKSTEFAYNFGGGARVEFVEGLEMFGGLRLVHMGTTKDNCNVAGVCTFNLEHSAVEAQVGMTVAFSFFQNMGQ